MELLIWIFIIGAGIWWYVNRRKASMEASPVQSAAMESMSPAAAAMPPYVPGGAPPAAPAGAPPNGRPRTSDRTGDRTGDTAEADLPPRAAPAAERDRSGSRPAPVDADDVDGWTESAAAQAASMHDPAAGIHRPGALPHPPARPGQEHQHGGHGPCRASEFPASPGTGTGTSRHCGWDGSESEEIVHHHAGSNRSGYPFDPAETPFGPGSAFAAWNGSGPEGYLIKGNESSMIYHAPGMPSYADTKAEYWFQTVEQAEAAGFRPPRDR